MKLDGMHRMKFWKIDNFWNGTQSWINGTQKWYDPIGSILQRFYLKNHIINDFWGGVPDLMVGGARPNGVQTRLEYAPIFIKMRRYS